MNKKSFDDIFAVFLITYALAAFSYEKYMPEEIMKLVHAAAFAAFAVSWLGLSFKNGKRKSVIFPIFTILFWVLPRVVVYLANDGPKVFRMSIIMYVLSEFSDFLTFVPIKITAGAAGISVYGAMAVILLLCAACYLCGVFTEED